MWTFHLDEIVTDDRCSFCMNGLRESVENLRYFPDTERRFRFYFLEIGRRSFPDGSVRTHPSRGKVVRSVFPHFPNALQRLAHFINNIY